MRKKIMAVFFAVTLLMGMSVNVMAASSPVSQKDNTVVADKASTAPQTGEGDVLFYAAAAAIALSGTAAISGCKWKEQAS